MSDRLKLDFSIPETAKNPTVVVTIAFEPWEQEREVLYLTPLEVMRCSEFFQDVVFKLMLHRIYRGVEK